MPNPTPQIPLHSAQFVNASDLFEGLSDLWDEFAASEPNCSWGNNNRSLVTPETIIQALDACPVDATDLDELKRRAKAALPPGVYVDLDN